MKGARAEIMIARGAEKRILVVKEIFEVICVKGP